MTGHTRMLFAFVLFAFTQPLFAEEPKSSSKIELSLPALQYLSKLAAQNDGDLPLEDIDVGALISLSELGYNIYEDVPKPTTAETSKTKQAMRQTEKDALVEVLNKDPEICERMYRAVAQNGAYESSALQTFAGLGVKAIPAHLKMLEHKEPEIRFLAVTGITYAALDDEAVFPVETVLSALNRVAKEDADPEVKKVAEGHLVALVTLLTNENYRRELKEELASEVSSH